MSSATPVSIRQYRGRMARKILLILMPLALIPLVLIGSLAYLYGRGFIRQQAFTLLGAVAEIQSQRIGDQVETGERLLSRALQNPELHEHLDAALALDQHDSSEFRNHRRAIFNLLQTTNQPNTYYDLFLVVSPDGLIQMATTSELQGEKFSDQAFLALLKSAPTTRAMLAPAPLDDPEEPVNSFAIISFFPYRNEQAQEPQAYILGFVGSGTIRTFIENASYLTDQGYFITHEGRFITSNPYANSHNKLVFLQPPPGSETGIQPSSIDSEPLAIELEQSAFAHRNPVIAAYSWQEKLQIAWAVEILQSQVYNQIERFLGYGLIILFALLIFIGLVMWLLTRSLTKPILQLVDTVQRFTDGHWDQRSDIRQNDEVGLLATSFNTMADELSTMYNRLEVQVREQTGELNTLSQLSQVAISARNLDELLKFTLDMIVHRYNCKYAAAFLVESTTITQFATLRVAAGSPQVIRRASVRRIRLDSASLIGTVISENVAQVRPLIATTDESQKTQGQPRYYEAVIPLSLGEQTIGAINLFATAMHWTSTSSNPFSTRAISELQTIANHIAPSVRNFQLLEESQTNQAESELLYKASHMIAQAESEDELLQIASEALKQCAFKSAILVPTGANLDAIHFWRGNHRSALISSGAETPPVAFSMSLNLAQDFFTSPVPVVINALNEKTLPKPLFDLTQQMGAQKAAMIPILREARLMMLLVLGDAQKDQSQPGGLEETSAPVLSNPFSAGLLRPYENLAELYSITREKIRAQHDTRKRIAELEILSKISQTISVEIELENLFRIIHQQVEQVTGPLSTIGFGLYDTTTNMIQFPYLFEEGQALTIPSIPLGQGLSSIVLQTKRPLRLVEDTEQKTIELGALTVGKQAKSWLGVPLVFGGEAIGIIIAQDNEREQRFSEEDERLLATLAAQIAVVVRNARLFETSRQQSEQDRVVSEISDKIRQSVNLENILKVTADELGAALKLRKAHIEILPEVLSSEKEPAEQQFLRQSPVNGSHKDA